MTWTKSDLKKEKKDFLIDLIIDLQSQISDLKLDEEHVASSGCFSHPEGYVPDYQFRIEENKRVLLESFLKQVLAQKSTNLSELFLLMEKKGILYLGDLE